MEANARQDEPSKSRDQSMPSILHTENVTHNVPAMSPRSLVSIDKISLATGGSSVSQSTFTKRKSLSFVASDALFSSPLHASRDRASVSYTSLTDNPATALESRRHKKENFPLYDFRPANSTPFIFSYDCLKRVPAAAEAIKKMEEEVNRALKEYYHSAMSYHHNSILTGTNSANRASDNGTSVIPLESSTQTGLTQLFKNNITGAQAAQSYGSRIGTIFNTQTSQSQRNLVQIYSRASSNLQTILSKNHRRVNGFLPLRRKIFAFLFQPFSFRPLNENNCRLSVIAIQNILGEFPLDTPEQLAQTIFWCLSALGNTNSVIKISYMP
ncbi:hypothetical protein DSO57_1019456 [Entomophthora muscae]|uniref:Uncharacterized protein n=1 Tax=Entomophthora muscae TaxID=34485 RepID=A0ACC2TRC8_9FUNG|nr:hypothetical protein DSO57_1019456 [Entomophthora muscae]